MVAPVRVEGLTVRFGSLAALDGVTHTFEPGTATAVMGVNGSGKTTMLECIAGLQRPSSGRITGTSDRIAYVCQHLRATWMPITAGEVMAMGRYRERGLIRRLRAADRDAVKNAGEMLDVNHISERSFGDLSGGQQQRVRIAQVLASEPDVLLLDEPVTGLDIPSQERIITVVDEYSRRGCIVIITTHHLDEARHCDSVMLMANRIIASGPPDEVLTSEQLCEAFGDRLIGDHADHHHGDDQEMRLIDDHGYHAHGHGHHTHGHDHDHHGDQGHGQHGGHQGEDCQHGPGGHG